MPALDERQIKITSFLLLKSASNKNHCKVLIETLPKALRSQALTALTSNVGLLEFGSFGPASLAEAQKPSWHRGIAIRKVFARPERFCA